MIRIEFTQKETEALRYERFNHPHPGVQQKMETLLLKSQNLPHRVTAETVGISSAALWRYLIEYREGGTEKLKELRFYKLQSELTEHKNSTEEYFKENPPSGISEAVSETEELTGIKRSPAQILEFLKKTGMRRLGTGAVPSKADTEEQEEFLKKKLNPRIDEAESGEGKLFFMDAAHFVLPPYPGYLWCFIRQFIKAPAGRKRCNVPGAADAVILHTVII